MQESTSITLGISYVKNYGANKHSLGLASSHRTSHYH